jgi:DNA processing protein
MNKDGIYTIIYKEDKEYPETLLQLSDPPKCLYCLGDVSLLKNRCIGIVGSRKFSDYGEKVTNKIINVLKGKDVVILSGLARGIDTIAHEAALRNNLKTIAVLGVGIERIYPKENFYLYQKIKKEGLIISEYPYKEVVCKNSFVLRNRLIAGLSTKLLVPELQDKSGTLITVRFALSFGKEILVVPTSIFSTTYNNQLIFQGATPILEGKDIFD